MAEEKKVLRKGIGDCMYDNELSEFGFDTEFTSDEDVEEMLDELITTIGSDIVEVEEGEDKVSIIDPYRIQQVLYTYKVLKYLTSGTSAKVSCVLHEPYISVGYVRVTGSDIQIRNTEWFLKAVELASNFEALSKTDGTVEMNFTFHGITRSVE